MAGKLVEYRCSFCRKGEGEVKRLVAGGGGVFICDECIVKAGDILKRAPSGTTTKLQ